MKAATSSPPLSSGLPSPGYNDEGYIIFPARSPSNMPICILSANGVISYATLRQPDSSGCTLTYEGRFEILTLTGSFMHSESGGIRNRSGGMSVSLASPDGRVVGGGVAGLLVAASPIQIVVGSFLAGNQHEQKPKKRKGDETVITAPSLAIVPISAIAMQDSHAGVGHHSSSGI